MKFLPVAAFESLNGLLHQVETQGFYLTVRLEAYSCRRGKEESRTEAAIILEQQLFAQANSGNSSDFVFESNNGSSNASPELSGGAAQQPQFPVPKPDDRLVFLVSALNSVYGSDYDFAVLTESDFTMCHPGDIDSELQQLLCQAPPGVTPAAIWQAVTQALGSTSVAALDECEYFRLDCPTANPLSDKAVWSSHYFVYSKRQKLIISLQMYGESNLYRGDDRFDDTGLREEDEVGSPKNRDFYGF